MSSNALVTGGAGFIGSHVAEALLASGWTVTVLDNLSSGKRAQVPAGARFVDADIRSPAAAALIRDGDFDLVCHLAAQIDVRKSVADPRFDVEVNIGGTLNLVEAVRASGRRTRFVFASTGGAVYGDLVTPPNVETFAKNPESPYGIAKFSVELYLAYYARVHGLDYVALRFANVYGPRQDPHGEAVHPRVVGQIELDGELRDPVGRLGVLRERLDIRRRDEIAVDGAAGRGEDESGATPARAHRLDEVERAADVDLDVEARVSDALPDIDLRREVADEVEVTIANERRGRGAADVGVDEARARRDLRAFATRQVVEDGDGPPRGEEGLGDVRPNEPGTAGDEGVGGHYALT